MVQVIWAAEASDDLEEIGRFVARDSQAAAQRLTARIVQSTRRLEQFPRSGRIVPEFRRENIREVFAEGYRVVYRVEVDAVRVLAGQDGARPNRDLPGL